MFQCRASYIWYHKTDPAVNRPLPVDPVKADRRMCTAPMPRPPTFFHLLLFLPVHLSLSILLSFHFSRGLIALGPIPDVDICEIQATSAAWYCTSCGVQDMRVPDQAGGWSESIRMASVKTYPSWPLLRAALFLAHRYISCHSRWLVILDPISYTESYPSE